MAGRRQHPFAEAMVPADSYRTYKRVSAVMVEINRALYLVEPGP